MKLIDKDAVVAEIEKRIEENKADIQRATHKHLEEYFEGYEDALVLFKEKFIDTLEVKEINENPEPAYRSKIIKVKCISPFDETWEKGKVYICEKWHHGDLNMDFWDVYYDYGSNPIYVQFSSVEMLEKEFAILRNDTLEAKEVSLEDLQEEHIDFIKLNTMLDESLSKETKESWNERLGEESVSENLNNGF